MTGQCDCAIVLQGQIFGQKLRCPAARRCQGRLVINECHGYRYSARPLNGQSMCWASSLGPRVRTFRRSCHVVTVSLRDRIVMRCLLSRNGNSVLKLFYQTIRWRRWVCSSRRRRNGRGERQGRRRCRRFVAGAQAEFWVRACKSVLGHESPIAIGTGLSRCHGCRPFQPGHICKRRGSSGKDRWTIRRYPRGIEGDPTFRTLPPIGRAAIG